MAESPDEEERRWIAQFEEMGEAMVRLQMQAGNLTGSIRPAAFRWLIQRDKESVAAAQERLERNDASTSEQIRLARTANQIAKHARNAAIAALIVATIGTIATIVGWFIH